MAKTGLRGHAVGMKTPPAAGSIGRIGVALLLCAACFQAGRSYQKLSASADDAATADTGSGYVDASFSGPSLQGPAVAPAPTAAPGDPVGQSGDLITPLNVRDPAALVMRPADHSCATPDAAEPEPRLSDPPYKEPKPKKLKEGRLLELLKKEDKKSVYPKRF